MSSPKYFKAWIIFFLIATVGGMIFGGFIGGVLGLFLGLAHVELGTIKLICTVVGFILGLPLSYFAYRWTVSEFIVKELAKANAAAANASSEPKPLPLRRLLQPPLEQSQGRPSILLVAKRS